MFRLGVPLFAVGNHARGVIAFGNIATGVIAVGNVARGVIAIGNVAMGAVFGAGNVALGLVAVGNVAVAPLAAFGASIGVGGVFGCAVGVGIGAHSGHVLLNALGASISRPFGASSLQAPIGLAVAPIAWLVLAEHAARDRGFVAWVASLGPWLRSILPPRELAVGEAPTGRAIGTVLEVRRERARDEVRLRLDTGGVVVAAAERVDFERGARVSASLRIEAEAPEASGYREAGPVRQTLYADEMSLLAEDADPRRRDLGAIVGAGYRAMILVAAALALALAAASLLGAA